MSCDFSLGHYRELLRAAQEGGYRWAGFDRVPEAGDLILRHDVDLSLDAAVTLVSDAHSTTDNAVLTAQQTIAYHNDILQMAWSDDHGDVVSVTVKPTNDIFAGMS